jgi:hypothetical protein
MRLLLPCSCSELFQLSHAERIEAMCCTAMSISTDRPASLLCLKRFGDKLAFPPHTPSSTPRFSSSLSPLATLLHTEHMQAARIVSRGWRFSSRQACMMRSAAASAVQGPQVLLVVGVALIDSASSPPRVLLAQRPPGKANEGLWELPGGKASAARRMNACHAAMQRGGRDHTCPEQPFG